MADTATVHRDDPEGTPLQAAIHDLHESWNGYQMWKVLSSDNQIQTLHGSQDIKSAGSTFKKSVESHLQTLVEFDLDKAVIRGEISIGDQQVIDGIKASWKLEKEQLDKAEELGRIRRAQIEKDPSERER